MKETAWTRFLLRGKHHNGYWVPEELTRYWHSFLHYQPILFTSLSIVWNITSVFANIRNFKIFFQILPRRFMFYVFNLYLWEFFFITGYWFTLLPSTVQYKFLAPKIGWVNSWCRWRPLLRLLLQTWLWMISPLLAVAFLTSRLTVSHTRSSVTRQVRYISYLVLHALSKKKCISSNLTWLEYWTDGSMDMIMIKKSYFSH